MKEIYILCNSPECLAEIASGNFPDLHTKDIFTCGSAFTFFRTYGKHFNFITDGVDIVRHINHPEYLFRDYRDKVLFVFSKPETEKLNVKTIIPFQVDVSPVNVAASSAINALFFLNAQISFPYDVIHLIGYTINEWDGMEELQNLRQKKLAFDEVFKNYNVENPRPFYYKYTRK